MRQVPIVFGHGICAESPAKSFPHCHIQILLSPYLAAKRASHSRNGARMQGNGGVYRGLTMLRMVAFCRPLVAALALCAAAIAVSVTPASARPYHRSAHHAHAYVSHQVRWHNVQYHSRHHYRYVRREAPQCRRPAMPLRPPPRAARRVSSAISPGPRIGARYSKRRASRPSLRHGRAALSKAPPFPTRAA